MGWNVSDKLSIYNDEIRVRLFSNELVCIGVLELHRKSIQDVQFASFQPFQLDQHQQQDTLNKQQLVEEEEEEEEDLEITSNTLAVASADGRISLWFI